MIGHAVIGPWPRTAFAARMRGASSVVALVVGLVLAGCDSPGGGPQGVAPDGLGEVHIDAASVGETVPDTAPETSPSEVTPDSNAPEATPDTSVPEVAQDTGPTSVCAAGCLPVSTDTAPTGVVFRQFGSARPTLRGGDAPGGEWVLALVDIYSQGTFADGIEVALGDHGATAGRMVFEGDAVGMALDLDLDVTVTAFGSTGSETAKSLVAVGGCHEVEGTHIVGNLGNCAEGFEPGSAPLASLDFELGGGTLAIGVELSRDSLIALFPADQRDSAEFAITGPLYLVSRFERP